MRATNAERRRRRAPWLGLVLALASACATGRQAAASGSGETGLEEITPGNVAGLQPVCTFEAGGAEPFHVGPTADGVVYLTTEALTFAVQGATCALLWRHEHPLQPRPPSGGDQGAAYRDGRLFRTFGDGHVVALDATSGRALWEVALGPPATDAAAATPPDAAPPAAGISPTPTGLVFTGDRDGNVLALEAATGKELWRAEAGQPIGAGVVSYTAGGRHLVAAGGRAASGPQGGMRSRLVVFGVRGRAGPERRRPTYID